MSSGNEPEKSTKTWSQYEAFELKDYISRYFDKADCSFVITDPTTTKDSKRELRSFRWMLSEMSPVLKGILTDEKNRAKNFKSIPISDKHFGGFLSYAHTKSFVNRSFDYMLDLYESSKQYKSEILKIAITNDINCKDPTGNWMRYAAFARRNQVLNAGLYYTFDSRWYGVIGNDSYLETSHTAELKKSIECELASNVETFANFDSNLFHHFLEFVHTYKISPLLCFKIAEAHLLKHVFKGKTPDKIEDEDNLNIDIINYCFKHIPFSKMSIEDFNNGPAKSAFLDEASKKYFRSLVRK